MLPANANPKRMVFSSWGSGSMKAQTLLSGAAYGPERLKDIYQAFDAAWKAIEPVVDDTPLAREAARLKLANMILDVAGDDMSAPNGKQPNGMVA